jgi:hypothetical protein
MASRAALNAEAGRTTRRQMLGCRPSKCKPGNIDKPRLTLPEGAINAQGRFSLSPASPQIVPELERLLKAATGQAAGATSGAKSETPSAPISVDLWHQLKPGSLVLAAGFDEEDNLAGWWEAIIVRIDDGEIVVRWRDDPKEPRVSRSEEYIALLHPKITGA